MKKLLLLLILSLGFIGSSNAEEGVNLICERYQVIYASTPLEIHKIKDKPESLVIFYESKRLIHYGSSETFVKSKNSNQIVWKYFNEKNQWRRYYSLDRTTGILSERLQMLVNIKNNEYQDFNTTFWQCKKSENLF